MAANRDQERALELIEKAMKHQMAQEFEDAIRLYKESIALYPTADAHTIQKSSSTKALAGPSLPRDHVAPPLALANMPTAVPI